MTGSRVMWCTTIILVMNAIKAKNLRFISANTSIISRTFTSTAITIPKVFSEEFQSGKTFSGSGQMVQSTKSITFRLKNSWNSVCELHLPNSKFLRWLPARIRGVGSTFMFLLSWVSKPLLGGLSNQLPTMSRTFKSLTAYLWWLILLPTSRRKKVLGQCTFMH